MNYAEYEGFSKPYIVQHNTGTGVMEDPYKPKKVVGEFDTKEEAESFANKLFKENNTPEQIKSTWFNNTYWVNVNTSSDEGKELFEKLREGFKEFEINEEEYKEIKLDGYSIYFKKKIF